MVAHVVLVHHDHRYSDDLVVALAGVGLTHVTSFIDPLAAWDHLLVASRQRELLITQLDFGAGRLHGAALARIVQHRRGGLGTILLGHEKYQSDVMDTGSLLPYTTEPKIVAACAYKILTAES